MFLCSGHRFESGLAPGDLGLQGCVMPFPVQKKQIIFSFYVLASRSECVIENYISYFSIKTYVVGTQKNRLSEISDKREA